MQTFSGLNGLLSLLRFLLKVSCILYSHGITLNICTHCISGKISEHKAKAHAHLKIVGLVGSIDNDMSLTDLTIGAPTALHRICEAIDNINSTAASHSRAFVLEVMGRHCGWLALLAGVSGGADFIFIPERPPSSMPWEDEMCAQIHRVSCLFDRGLSLQ